MATGVPAGTLYVEVVAELAKLQQDMQTVKREVGSMSTDVVRQTRRAADGFDGISAGATKAGGASRMMGQQLSQVAQQVAAGTNAIQALAIQLPDIAIGMGAAGASAGRFATFMSGPWGIAISSAVAVLGSLGAQHLAASDASDQQAKDALNLSKAIDALNESVVRETRSQQQNTQARLENAFALRKQTEETLKLAQAEIRKQMSFLAGAEDQQANAMNGQQFLEAESRRNTAITALNDQLAKVQQLQGDINKSDASIRGLQAIVVNEVGGKYFDAAGQSTQRFDNRLGELTARFRDGKITLQQYTREAAQLRGVLHAEQEAIEAANKANGGRNKGLSEAEKAARSAAREFQQLVDASTRYAEQLEDQAAKFGLSTLAVQRLEVAAKAAAAPTAALAQRIRDAGAALEGRQIAKAVEDFDKMITAIYDEIELSALAGKARDLRALELEKEGKMAEWAALGLTDLNNKWMQYAAARLAGIEQQSALDRDAKAAAKLADALELVNQQFADMVGVLQGMEGLAGGLGGFLQGLHTGNFANLGPAGGLLNIALGGGDKYQEQADLIADRISDVFGVSGPFAKTLGSILQGASTGTMAGSLIGNSKANQLGGMIGGALGQEAGKALGSSLGKLAGVAGPLGSILGGVLGSALGGLFKKDKYGTATVVSGFGYGTSGNSSKSQPGANALAESLQSALNSMAKQFDTALGQFAVSIGVTNGKINVNPGAVTGMIGTTKQRDTIDFGENEAGALKWAIKNAIDDGALKDLSDGWKKFLTAATADIEVQVQRLSDLKSSYDELASLKDPQGFALEQLDKAFAALRATATEAGDDLVRLEELYGLKRKEIVEKYSTDTRDLEIEILELQGRSVEALAMSRQAELDAADASIRPLLERRNALLDEAQAAQAAATAAADKAAADDRIIALQVRYSRLIGDEVTARALEQMQELNEARTDEERQYLRMIHETDRLMEQQSKAASSMSQFANGIAAVAEAAYKASAELRAYANEIFDEAMQSDPAVLLGQIQAAMKAGNTAVLPDLIKAYLPFAEDQSGSLVDYQRQVAYLRQGSLNAADYADARTDLQSNAMAWISRQLDATGQSAVMPEGFYSDQGRLEDAIKRMEERLADLLERSNSIGANQVVELQGQTKTIGDAFNGGAGIVVLEPVDE